MRITQENVTKTYDYLLQYLNDITDLEVEAIPSSFTVKCTAQTPLCEGVEMEFGFIGEVDVYCFAKYRYALPKIPQSDKEYIVNKANAALTKGLKFLIQGDTLCMDVLAYHSNSAPQPKRMQREISKYVYQVKKLGDALISLFSGKISYGEYLRLATFK